MPASDIRLGGLIVVTSELFYTDLGQLNQLGHVMT